MAFKAVRYDSGKVISLPAKASQTIAKGDGLKNNGGYLIPTVSGDNADVEFVAMAAYSTSGTDGDLIRVIPVRGVQFIVDCSNTPTQAQMLTAVDLSAAGTIDTSATTDQVFFAAALVGAASDKKILGWFTNGVPNS